MPIIFPELENILIEWKKISETHNPKNAASKFVFDNIQERAHNINTKKIYSLFKRLDISNIVITESLNPDRTYGKLTLEKNIVIDNNLPKSSL